ncbi:MAG: S26 family signal peptidase, partial [Candidatus Phytoplasma stylosanthis]|nr:S26 family signal peptidase [Candidatus Phytoplasma stylosanthis]
MIYHKAIIFFKKFCFFFFNYFIYNIIVIIFLYIIILNILHYFYPKYTYNLFLFNIYHVPSDSMEPIIKENSFIIVKKINYNDCANLQNGDIIMFYVDEEYQTNEILKKVPLVVHEVQNNNLSKREVTTKGINNEHI